MNKDSLGDRIKAYENCFRYELPRRMPIIIRVDGKAFHTYTKQLKEKGEPYNILFHEVMDLTALKLCEEIQGVQIAYIQSDEISLLLHNYKNLYTQPWFSNNLQKMISVSAAIASATFTAESWRMWSVYSIEDIRPAYFDSRIFILPEHEVCNYFIWRQQDCTRNSVQSLARAHFSHKECLNKNGSQLQDMCRSIGKNWDNEPTFFKRGRSVIKVAGKWIVDNEIPIFSQSRNYIESLLSTEDDK